MNVVTLKQFLQNPEQIVKEASEGYYTAVKTGGGHIAVIIDDPEWTMLRQAMAICIEHPELVLSKIDTEVES